MPVTDEHGVAIVVVSYNHAHTLEACLEAVRMMCVGLAAELVVVDNCSHDHSAAIASAHGAAVHRLPGNTGFAAAANHGIAATSAPWVLILNPDCAPRSDFLRQLSDAAEQSRGERLGALTGKLLRSRGSTLEATSIIDSTGMVMSPSGRHFDRGAGEEDRGQYDRPAWVFGGSGAATMFWRPALEDVAYPGGEVFAESFFAYREDAELAWRLQLRGWRCRFEPSAVAAHQRGFQPEGGRRGHQLVNRLSVRNRFLLRWHCADLAWHLRALPWWLLRDLLVVGACLSVEGSSLGAFTELWRLRHDARQRRRWVQSRRQASARQMQRWFRTPGQAEEITAR